MRAYLSWACGQRRQRVVAERRCPYSGRRLHSALVSNQYPGDQFMVSLVETTWLFVRGSDSVRMIRASTPEGRARLLVYGPGNTQAVLEFEDAFACTTAESD